MSPRTRRKTSAKIAAKVMLASDRTCCICRTARKDLQIHHIDGNSQNNNPQNLAVLCLNCHSDVTGKPGFGKGFSRFEVRLWKADWERTVLRRRKVFQPRAFGAKELVSQIDLIVCQILADDGKTKRSKELLDTLYNLKLWRGSRQVNSRIVEGLEHLALMSGISSPKLSRLVTDLLWQICWHFFDPKEINMSPEDTKLVLRCAKAVGTVVYFNCGFAHSANVLKTVSQSAQSFFEVGLWYARRQICKAIIEGYREALESCYEDKTLKFPGGRALIRRSCRRLLSLLGKERPRWTTEKRALDRIITA